MPPWRWTSTFQQQQMKKMALLRVYLTAWSTPPLAGAHPMEDGDGAHSFDLNLAAYESG